MNKYIAAFPKVKVIVSTQKIDLEQSTDFLLCLQTTDNALFWIDQMRAYANKKPILFPINVSFSPFSKEVLQAIGNIPFGKTKTYGEIAAICNNPKAQRAVGSICNKNPYPLFIPCHRVLSKKDIGGYAFSQEIKKELLCFERQN